MLKYIFPIALLLTACGSEEETNRQTGEKKSDTAIVVTFENEAEMDKRKTEIDTIVAQADMIASSLYYAKGETGESIEVNGHMNKQNTILKVVEFFNDGNGGNSGQRIYYLNGGKPFLTQELFDDVSGTKPQFVDRISYYDNQGKVIKTKERRGDYQELVERMSYRPVSIYGISMNRAMRALNQEAEFETTFQGFIHQEVFTYMSVGENKPDGFRSALRCDYKDPLIMALSANESGYLGEKLRVNYQKHVDQTGFEFQVYAGGKFADVTE